jgi:hypothetical protein
MKLTPAQMRATVDKTGEGETLTQRVQDCAARWEIGERQVWRYLDGGLPDRMNRRTQRVILDAAAACGAIATAEAEAGVFL